MISFETHVEAFLSKPLLIPELDQLTRYYVLCSKKQQMVIRLWGREEEQYTVLVLNVSQSNYCGDE